MVQHVSSPTRRDRSTGRENILDLIVSKGTAQLMSNVQVVSAHDLSDHELVICSIEIKRTKSPPANYKYRDIKGIDISEF